jgi:Na+-translocating ferredoxin:NAD+ oxidoreductase RnfC subunit
MKKGLVVGLSYLSVIAWGFLPTLSSQMSRAVASVNRDSLNGTLRDRNASESVEQRFAQQTKRLKIQLELTTPQDLKVEEGQHVVKGQLIANYQQQPIAAPYAGSILRVRLLSRHSGLLKYEVVLLTSHQAQKPSTINY